MHDILEGVLPLEVRLMLQVCLDLVDTCTLYVHTQCSLCNVFIVGVDVN